MLPKPITPCGISKTGTFIQNGLKKLYSHILAWHVICHGSNFNLPTTKSTVYRTVLIPIIFLRFLTNCHTVECPGHLEIQPSWAVPKKTTKEEVGSFHFIFVLRMTTHTHTHTQQCTENVTKASSVHLICNKLGSDCFHFKITWLAGLPWWFSGEESACQWGRHGFDPQSGKIPHAGAIKPSCHNHWACVLEPGDSNKRSHHSEKPAHHNSRVPPLSANYSEAHRAVKTQNSQK